MWRFNMVPAVTTVWAALLLSADVPQQGTIRGEWYLAATADERRTDAGSPNCRMAIGDEGRVLFRINDLVTNRGVIQLGPGERLWPIDLRLSDGTRLLGVCLVEGDRLDVCFEAAGKARPAGIEPRGSQWLERWKRVKP